MSCPRKTAPLAALAAAILGLLGPQAARGDLVVSGSFGPYGDVNTVPTSPANLSISYGADGQGSVYQLDGFVNVQGVNLNPTGMTGVGNSAELGYGPPAGIGYTFAATQPTADQLLLTYTFTNNTGSALNGFQFFSYADPDVAANYPYEYAKVNGTAGQGPAPSSFQVSDATYGSIFTNIGNGSLSNTNDLPGPSQTGDVSAALGFTLATLGAGQSATFQVLLSDDGSTLNGFSITQEDSAYPGDHLTISGSIVVPEPPSALLLAVGSLAVFGTVRRRLNAS